MLKLPSINKLWVGLQNILIRFPLQSLIALFAMILWLSVADHHTGEHTNAIHKLLALSLVAFSFSLSSVLFAESRGMPRYISWLIQIIVIGLSYSIAWFIYPEYFQKDVLKVILLVLAGHLSVSFGAYINQSNRQAFWHFNKVLFLRFFTSVLFSIVLYIGLAIALYTTEALFQVNFDGDIYYKLFIIIAAGFNTLFFLDGIPTKLNESTERNDYPKALKIFTQYVLIPLLTIYLAILLIYELKIIISMQLPDGLVSILIMGYAVFGILSYLLIYPIRKNEEKTWVNQFSKLFFWFMIPLLILLFVAITVRIQDYGITEMRYFVFVLALWLAYITFYFTIKKEPNIKMIPVSLFIATILSVSGPQSASNISKKSQQSRLREELLKSTEQVKSEKISVINYLVNHHGLTALQEFTNRDLTEIQRETLSVDSLRESNYLTKSTLRDTAFFLLGVDRIAYDASTRYINFTNQEKGLLNTGFDYTFWIEYRNPAEDFQSPLGNINVATDNNQSLIIKIGTTDSVRFDMDEFRKEIIRLYKTQTNVSKTKAMEPRNEMRLTDANNAIVSPSRMTLKASNNQYYIEIRIQHISFNLLEKTPTYFPPFSGFVVIQKK